MKTPSVRLRFWLTLLAALYSVQVASAYYDPGVQRWINRDPLGELGHASVVRQEISRQHRQRLGAELVQPPSLFSFLGNSPLARHDPFGLEYDSEECAGLLAEIDFLYTLLGRTGLDWNTVKLQIMSLEQEYDDNCGDDFGGPPENPDPVPVCPRERQKKPELCRALGVAAGGTVGAYITYRCVRMIPSLLPPFWVTIPANVVVP
jgi:hypothetical protein